MLTADWLVSHVFSFETGTNRSVVSGTFLFDPDGQISGYSHPNEAGWRIEGDEVLILRQDGVPTCRAQLAEDGKGGVELKGRFLFGHDFHPHYFRPVSQRNQLPAVQTFDLFDTLIARHCFGPLAVFDRIEAKSQRRDFAKLRREVEAALWSRGNYTFDDIYQCMMAAAGWLAPEIEKLKMLELAEEWDNLFPIREMIARVRPGDMIVSDMYLPEAFIRRLVDEKCGLRGMTIHLSNHGKHHGTIWPKVQAERRILRHHGDNHHSDVLQVQRAGIEAHHVTMFKWTRGEEILNELGLDEFARVIRRERLESFTFDEVARQAQLAQLEINIPLLVIASLLVIQHGRGAEIDTLLMCGRDCNLWVELMRYMTDLAGWRPAIHYFPSSRDLFLRESPAYAAYFDRVRGQRSLVVDISGTGRTPAQFIGRVGAAHQASIFIALKSESIHPAMEKRAPARSDVQIVAGVRADDERFYFERLNTAPEGRAVDMAFENYRFQVVRDPSELSERGADLVNVMHTTFASVVRRLRDSELCALPGVRDEQMLRAGLQEIVRYVGRYHNVMHYLPG